MRDQIPVEAQRALDAAKKTSALHKQDGTIRRFDLSGCTLFVVPFRRWAMRKQERLTAEFWQQQRVR